MQVVVKGKNMEVSDKLRTFVEGKITRLQRFLPDLADVEVELSSAKTRSADSRYVVQVTLSTNGVLIRGEQAAARQLLRNGCSPRQVGPSDRSFQAQEVRGLQQGWSRIESVYSIGAPRRRLRKLRKKTRSQARGNWFAPSGSR